MIHSTVLPKLMTIPHCTRYVDGYSNQCYCIRHQIGKLGYELDKGKSLFQYNPEFLDSGKYPILIPFIFKRTKAVQVFKEYQGDTFQGLPL